MEARIILSCSPPVHPSVVSQLYFTMFDILPKTWFLQCSPRLFVLHFHVSAGFCQQRLTTWDNYWIFWRSTKTPFRPMHLDFQREEDVCTETCDRIDTVITIVIKTVTKGLFTWSGGPRSNGAGFFCFHALGDTKQKKPTPLDRGPPLHVNRV